MRKRVRLAGLHVSESVLDGVSLVGDASLTAAAACSCTCSLLADHLRERLGKAGEIISESAGERCGFMKRRKNAMATAAAKAVFRRASACVEPPDVLMLPATHESAAWSGMSGARQ